MTKKADIFGSNIPVGDGISILGSHRLVVSLINSNDPTDERGDFIDNDCFDFLVLDEEAGLRLPLVKIGFRLYNYDILKYLNQGNILRIFITSFVMNSDGSTEEEVGVSSDFILLKPKVLTESNMKIVTLVGIYDAVGFVDDRFSRTFKKMTSKDAFFWVASQYFDTDFDFDKEPYPSDEQNWIQSNQSDKDFMKHLFIYSNYEGSFPITGITINGKFRYRDFKNYVTQNIPKYNFIFSETEVNEETMGDPNPKNKPNEIIHNGDIVDISNAGMLNLWRGAGSIVPVLDMDSGGPPVLYESSVDMGLLTGNATGNRNIRATPAYLDTEYDNDNTYDGFPESKSRNVSGAVVYSSQVLSFTFRWKLHPLQVLDFVTLEESDSPWSADGRNDPKNALASVTSSGKYVISRVTRKITKKILTRIEVCRESPMEQYGALK